MESSLDLEELLELLDELLLEPEELLELLELLESSPPRSSDPDRPLPELPERSSSRSSSLLEPFPDATVCGSPPAAGRAAGMSIWALKAKSSAMSEDGRNKRVIRSISCWFF